MNKSTQLMLGASILIAIVFIQPAASSARVEEVFFPKIQSTSAELRADENNNLLVSSEPYFNWLNAEFWGEQAIDHYDYNLQNRNYRGKFDAEQRFSPGHPFLLEFDNTTTDQTVVNFQTRYYSLFKGESQRLEEENSPSADPNNIALYAGQSYGFILSVNQARPIFLSVVTATIRGGNAYTMNVRAIDPKGGVFSSNVGMTQDTQNLIPIVPLSTGDYIIFLTPTTDVIVSQIKVEKEPEIIVTPNGISEKITGDKTIGKFIRISTDIQPQAFNIRQFVDTNLYLGGLNYMGAISFRIFSLAVSSSPLGLGLGSTTVVTSDKIYIAVVATPPDESDPAVKGAKSDANLPEGMELSYTLTAESLPLSELPLNTDFRSNQQYTYSSTVRHYRVMFDTDVLIGVNATNTVFPQFIPQNSELGTTTISSITNDVMNDPSADFVRIKSGLYVVSVPVNQKIHFTVLKAQIFQGDSLELSVMDSSFSLVKIPKNGYSGQQLNISFTNTNNQSSLVRISLYNVNGNLLSNSLTNFTRYYNSSSQLVINNQTQITTTVDTRDQYIVFHTINTTLYTANGIANTNLTKDVRTNLRLTSTNLVDIWNKTSNVSVFEGVLDEQLGGKINATNSQVQMFLTIPAKENHGYRVVIDSVNSTILGAHLWYDANNLWFTDTQNTPITINNETHYQLEIVFATSEATDLGLNIILGPVPSVASYNITIMPVEIQKLPSLDFKVIKIAEPTQESLLEKYSGFIVGGLVIGMVAVTTILFLRRRRK